MAEPWLSHLQAFGGLSRFFIVLFIVLTLKVAVMGVYFVSNS